MNIKLAIKNIRKSFQDYTIYFLTLVLGVAIFYMFNSLYAQQEVIDLKEFMIVMGAIIDLILSYLSVFVAIILGFLIVYINNFFIKRRKKELGLYMLLGISKNKISQIILSETLIIGFLALIVGILFGIIGSQFMSVITAKLFKSSIIGYKFIFAKYAVMKSIIYFSIIFITVGIFNIFNIRKCELIDLLYDYKKNENIKIGSNKMLNTIFFSSVIFLLISYCFISINGFRSIDIYLKLAILFGIIGTFLFFYSVYGSLIKFIKLNKNIYYKGLNVFILRQISSKVNTNFISISVICIILVFVICSNSIGFTLQKIISQAFNENNEYNISIYKDNFSNSETNIYNNLPDNIKNFKGIKNYTEINIYNNENIDFIANNEILNIDKEDVKLLKLSQFNMLLKQLNKEEYNININDYLILKGTNNNKELNEKLLKNNTILSINGNNLSLNKIIENIVINNGENENIFVVDDKLLENSNIKYTILNINTNTIDDEMILKNLLREYEEPFNEKLEYDKMAYTNFKSKNSLYQISLAIEILISFICIYLGIIFMITCATIISIQQISEISDNKFRYNLLKKLGTEKKSINKALFIQILFYFLLPLSLAILHSIFILNNSVNFIEQIVNIKILDSITITSLFVVFVYGLYFILTYIVSKNIINKK